MNLHLHYNAEFRINMHELVASGIINKFAHTCFKMSIFARRPLKENMAVTLVFNTWKVMNN